MSKFTDVALVRRESVDVEDGTSDLDGGPDSRANIPLLRRFTRVRPRDSREAARDKFEHSVRISSVVKYRTLQGQEKSPIPGRFGFSERPEICLCIAHGSAWLIKGSRGSIVSAPTCARRALRASTSSSCRRMHVRYLVDGRWEPRSKANRMCLKIDSRATRKFVEFPHLTRRIADRFPVSREELGDLRQDAFYAILWNPDFLFWEASWI